MALTHNKVLEVADECLDVCDQLKAAYQRAKLFLETNSDLAIDWAGDPKPSYINEDSAGNVDGRGFTRAQVANVIGSIDNFRKLMENATVTQGDHLGNVNQVATVKVS